MTEEIVTEISDRYKELYYQMIRKPIDKVDYSNILERIGASIDNSIN